MSVLTQENVELVLAAATARLFVDDGAAITAIEGLKWLAGESYTDPEEEKHLIQLLHEWINLNQ